MIHIHFDYVQMYDDSHIIKFKKWSDDMKDDITIYHVNLEKVKKKYDNNEPLSKSEKTLLVLCTNELAVLNDICKGEKNLEAVKNKLIELTKDEKFMELYTASTKDN